MGRLRLPSPKTRPGLTQATRDKAIRVFKLMVDLGAGESAAATGLLDKAARADSGD